MSLLTRIAISNGDIVRKARANKILAVMDQGKIVNWNKNLEAEAGKKQEECAPFYTNPISFISGGKS